MTDQRILTEPCTHHHGVLEVDHGRGVIYFHSDINGITTLRVCGMPTPMEYGEDVQHDVTLKGRMQCVIACTKRIPDHGMCAMFFVMGILAHTIYIMFAR